VNRENAVAGSLKGIQQRMRGDMLFKRDLFDKVLNGEKTATRRPLKKKGIKNYETGHIYGIRNGYTRYKAWVLIKRKYKQKLGDMTEEDAHKEGFRSLQEFQKKWTQLYGSWNPEQIVWVYEFKLANADSTSKDRHVQPAKPSK